MKEKAPTVEEIKEFKYKLNNAKDNCERQKIVEEYPRKNPLLLQEMMTFPLIEDADEEEREIIWKFMMKCGSFAHCPVSASDYKRMIPFAEDEVLVKLVLHALKKVGYPFKNDNFIKTTIYYYCIALISQSQYCREEILETMEKIIDFVIENKAPDASPLVRNMKVLSKNFEDLKPLYEKSKPIYAIVANEHLLSYVRVGLSHTQYYESITEEQIQTEYVNIETPIDGKVYIDIVMDEYYVKINENGKVKFSYQTKDFYIAAYAIFRDILYRQYIKELDQTDNVTERMNETLVKIYGETKVNDFNNNLAFHY